MNQEHPIQGLMTTAMNSIKDMVDVNTIIGEAVEAADGTIIIPISKVSFGFAAGGGDYNGAMDGDNRDKDDEDKKNSKLPFAGGSGAGVSISPVGFLVVGQGQIRLMPVGNNSSLDRLVDSAPDIFSKLSEVLRTKTTKKTKVETTFDGDVKEEERTNQ